MGYHNKEPVDFVGGYIDFSILNFRNVPFMKFQTLDKSLHFSMLFSMWIVQEWVFSEMTISTYI